MAILPEDLEKAFSLERFSRYLTWANNDKSQAIHLYTLNTKFSESLYTPLQTLEVALRNRIHHVMSLMYGDDWFNTKLLLDVQIEQLQKAREDLIKYKKDPTPGRIVAALTFSFWTSMFNKEYEDLWQQTLHEIAKAEDGSGLRRKDFSGALSIIRTLRNRVAHHEPILGWDLQKLHLTIIQLTKWLSPAAAEWGETNSSFNKIISDNPYKLHQD